MVYSDEMDNFLTIYRFFLKVKKCMPIGQRDEKNLFFISFAISALFFLIPIAIGLQLANFKKSAYSAYIGTAIIAISLALWKILKTTKIPFLLFQATLLWLVLYNAAILGGVISPTLVWLGIVPLLPIFVLSIKWAYIQLSFAFASIITFYIFDIGANKNLLISNFTMGAAFATGMFSTFIITQTILISTVVGISHSNLRKVHKKNRRLIKLSTQLSITNGHKDKFLTNISHEMRTPLNSNPWLSKFAESAPRSSN